jgi:hypothetical protein
MVTWLAGNRIRGTTAERPALGLPSGSVGGWKELGRHTLSSAGDYLEVSGIADKKYYMIIWNTPDGTASWCQPALRLGIGSVDTGTNYGERYWRDGVFGSAHMNTYNGLWSNASSPNKSCFGVSYISNESDREKLIINSSVDETNPPSRMQSAGKWTDVSAPIDLVRLEHMATGNGFNTDSECVVLGWDPADTHTTNFWEELASVSGDGTSTTLSSGTFTAKKYLWVQAYSNATSQDSAFQFNNDTVTNYSTRWSDNGGADSTSISESRIDLTFGSPSFTNMFIINNSANEKLCIHHQLDASTAGAGTAPRRYERVSKWANASAQITEIDYINQSTSVNFPSDSIMKVWGSD